MRKLLVMLLAVLLAAPATAMAAASIEDMQKQIQEMTLELNELSDRLDKPERHSATDRISWYGDLRAKADTLHYKDLTQSQGVFFDFADFGARAVPMTDGMPDNMIFDGVGNLVGIGGEFGDFTLNVPNDPTQGMMPSSMTSAISKFMGAYPELANKFMMGQLPAQGYFVAAAPESKDMNNDILYTTRLRLGMKAKVAKNVGFSGRLLMYKNWGDSTGAKVLDSWGAFTMDGTNSGNTTGDILHVERAYFDWKNIGKTPFYLSIGRRPSTYGPPNQYRENEMRGGTPSGHLVNFNFDGITVGYKLSKHTGVEGQTIRFCYGQGFESEFGNGELFNSIETDDVHLGGFNVDAINDGTNFLQFTLFKALDVTDGFKGVFAFPDQFVQQLAPTIGQDTKNFPNINFISRYQPSTNIGDITLGGVGFAREEMNGVNWFASAGWTQTEGNGKAGLFGGMLSDTVWKAITVGDPEAEVIVPVPTTEASENETRDGYSAYVGVQVPAPMGKFGLEYNYGSKYWTPFTQAQDDVVGSKLATRGHVGEAYYVFDINPRMFIKVGGIYYDYEYTGSGSPVGAPVKIDDIKAGLASSMLPVVDEAWDGYASLTVKF